MKQCSSCEEWKDESKFYRDYGKEDGLSSTCVKCRDKHLKDHKQRSWKKVNKQTKGKRKRNVNIKRFKISPQKFNPNLMTEELYSQFTKYLRPSWIVEDLSQFDSYSIRDDNGRLRLPDTFIPNIPGCYALIDKTSQEVLYIGKASALRSRIRQHFTEQEYSLRPGCLIDEINYTGYNPYICAWQCQVPHNSLLELLLLHYYTPSLNFSFE